MSKKIDKGHRESRGDHKGAKPPLIKGVIDAKVTLQQGLTAAAQQGRPISAKFEVEDGKLQLSVYTAKDGKFSEVIVDHMTGKVSETESITEGEDLAEAKLQSAAMEKAKTRRACRGDRGRRRPPARGPSASLPL